MKFEQTLLWLTVFGAVVILGSCGDNIEFGKVDEEKLDTSKLVKVELATGLDEPMEIAITPAGKVIVIERKGAVKMYNPENSNTTIIGQLNVYSGQEDGLLGVALDPAFKENSFLYFFYSPAGTTPIQRVSRFTLQNDSLLMASEKKLIDIPTQRQECCHSAGSLAFGPGGNLFIAVGDNTNPHNPGYYNSIDERKGREYWDAQRTASNTNDLRGKILRIHPEPDGSYTIPEGNLFPEGTPKTRPEIYAMGTRNPYRISVDQKRGWLFWGDVGQNTIDNPKRGPISYDEWHVAMKPGFFGWPYLAGPNEPYTDFDFETEEIGPFYDATRPVNNSVNNTGLQELPPAQPAMIWYSYDESKIFPHLGTGGKSPIAGPVFYTDLYLEKINDTTRHMHAYYDGKLFIAEWMRDWINVVTVGEDGKVDTIEPFMRGTRFNHPIDLEFGPDGILYVLDYGTNWFSRNKDAGLYRIEYLRGNNVPTAKSAGKGENAEPEIYFEVKNGNSTFYWPGTEVNYNIGISDKEDGSLEQGTIQPSDVKASLSYTSMGTDMAMVVQAHETFTSDQPSFPLINNSDCKSCHAMQAKSVGPSYVAISQRYRDDSVTRQKLAAKIINGGAGVWGEHAMSAHPQLSESDAEEMVKYILALDNESTQTKKIPVKGKFRTVASSKQPGDYVVTVSYEDKKQPGSASNIARKSFILRPPEVAATAAQTIKGATRDNKEVVSFESNESWIMFGQVDLSGIASASLRFQAGANAGTLQMKTGSPEGEVIGEVTVDGNGGFKSKNMQLKQTSGIHDVFIVYRQTAARDSQQSKVLLKTITFKKQQ